MNFEQALTAVKDGDLITRKGWEDKNQFVYRLNGTDLQNWLKYGYGEYIGEPAFIDTLIFRDYQNKLTIGWTPSISDLFAYDWIILEQGRN